MTGQFVVEIQIRVAGLAMPEREAVFDLLVEEAGEQHEVVDLDVGAALAAGTYDFTMSVGAADSPQALGAGLDVVRAMVEAAGARIGRGRLAVEESGHSVRPAAVA